MGHDERVEVLAERIELVLKSSSGMHYSSIAKILAELIDNREKALHKIIGALGFGWNSSYVPLSLKEKHLMITGAALAKISLDMQLDYYKDDGVIVIVRSL